MGLTMRAGSVAIVLGALIAAAIGTIDPAVAQDFKNKQIVIYAGSGGYDTYGRLLGQVYGKYLPGHPRFIVKNMPGAGTLLVTNYLYEVAPKDGTAMGAVGGGNATAHMFRSQGVRFDPRRFAWIGSMNSEVGMVLAWQSQPLKPSMTCSSRSSSSAAAVRPRAMWFSPR